MMRTDILKSLGLSDSEIDVYLGLLGFHSAPASSLARQLRMPRTTVKYCLEQLCQKGLSRSLERNGCSYYSPNPPSQLQTLLDLQKRAVEAQSAPLSAMIGDLMQKYRRDAVMPKVQFFEGAAGIIAMLQDVIDDHESLYGALHLSETMDPLILDYFTTTYIPERKKRQNPSWMLFNDNPRTRQYQAEDLNMNRLSLLVPEAEFPFESCLHVYGDKVAFYSYESALMSGVIIQDAYIRRVQFSLFKLAWDRAKHFPQNKRYQKVEL